MEASQPYTGSFMTWCRFPPRLSTALAWVEPEPAGSVSYSSQRPEVGEQKSKEVRFPCAHLVGKLCNPESLEPAFSCGKFISSPVPVQPHLSVNDCMFGGIRVWLPVQKEGSWALSARSHCQNTKGRNVVRSICVGSLFPCCYGKCHGWGLSPQTVHSLTCTLNTTVVEFVRD